MGEAPEDANALIIRLIVLSSSLEETKAGEVRSIATGLLQASQTDRSRSSTQVNHLKAENAELRLEIAALKEIFAALEVSSPSTPQSIPQNDSRTEQSEMRNSRKKPISTL